MPPLYVLVHMFLPLRVYNDHVNAMLHVLTMLPRYNALCIHVYILYLYGSSTLITCTHTYLMHTFACFHAHRHMHKHAFIHGQSCHTQESKITFHAHFASYIPHAMRNLVFRT